MFAPAHTVACIVACALLWTGPWAQGQAHAQAQAQAQAGKQRAEVAVPDPEPLQQVKPVPPPPVPASPTRQRAEQRPALPRPPKNYRVPPPPPGARYPGMEDIGPGGSTRARDGELRIPLDMSTRLRVLTTDLDALGSRGGASGGNGLLSIITGGVSLALGAIQGDGAFASFLYVFGAATVLRGGVDMVVTPDPTETALEFGHLPMRDLTEVKLRLRHGERGLRDLASDYRLARILDGSLNLAAGVTIIPLVLVPNDFAFEGPLDVFVAVGAGISIVSGLISLLSSSEAERRWGAYNGLRNRLAEPPAGTRTRSRRPRHGPRATARADTGVQLGMSAHADGARLRVYGRF